MFTEFYSAPEILSPIIRRYNIQELDVNSNEIIFPALTQNFIIFQYGDIYDIKTRDSNIIKGYRVMVNGCITSPFRFIQNKFKIRCIVVELQPAAFYRLFGTTIKHPVNSSYDVQKLLPDSSDILNALIELSTHEKRIKLLNDYFRNLLKDHDQSNDNNIGHMMHLINEFDKGMTIEELIDNKLSTRHFRRLFKRVFGIAPKLYIRILRLERVLSDFHHDIDLDYLSKIYCFSDQSHFIRECRKFTGRTPRQILKDFQDIHNRNLHNNLA
ncbi:MAG: AraC family transcriptional regulator [Leptospirales bacterium]